MKWKAIFRFIIAVLIAGALGDFIHIYYGHFVDGVVIYNSYINSISILTKSLEALGMALIYYLMGNRLHPQSKILSAIYLTILTCLIKDGFIRQPLMNVLIGNSILDSLLRESQAWLSSLAMSLSLVFLIRPKNTKGLAKNPPSA